MKALTYEQVSIIGSCLGINVYGAHLTRRLGIQKLPSEFYRNRFMIFKNGNKNEPILNGLVETGFMTRYDEHPSTIWFYVTDEGELAFRYWYYELLRNVCPLIKNYVKIDTAPDGTI